MSTAYDTMLREIVRDQGDPRDFVVSRVNTITDEHLAIIMRENADILFESTEEIRSHIQRLLSGEDRPIESIYFDIGICLLAEMRRRVLKSKSFRTDLACMADNMAQEDADETEYTRGVA